MSTNPETPPIPGDLTYAAMKLAALTLGLRVSGSPDPTDLARRVLQLGIAAAGVAPAPDNGRCGGCRDLGPHRNVPGCDYYEPESAPVTPSGAGVLRLLGCMIVNCVDCGDAAIGKVDDTEGGARCEGCAYDAGKRDRSAPSPDREKLEKAIRSAEGALELAGATERVWRIFNIGDERSFTTHELRTLLAALAVPPVVNTEEIAEIIDGRSWSWSPDASLGREIAAVLAERQREWLGAGA